MHVKKWILFEIIVLCLTSCVMGPSYQPPATSIPAKYNVSNNHAKNYSVTQNKQWWQVFHDKTLNSLIEKVKQSNLDIKTAAARVEEAHAQYNVSTAQFFPTINASALPPTGAGGDTLTQVLGLFLSWTPDLFGRTKSAQNMSKANLEAVTADHDFAVLNISAEIANAYWELRGNQEINQILLKYINTDQQIYKTLKRNYQLGIDNYMKVTQQDSLIETEKAEFSQNEAVIAALISKIEILSGENPGAFTDLVSTPSHLSTINIDINLGVPSTLLRRRPDIIAAERRVAATHANINAAIGDLFPNISVGWLLAWQSQTLAANVFSLQNSQGNYYATLNAPLVNYSLYKIVDLRKRQKAIAVIQYELTVLRALHDVTTTCNYYKQHKISSLHYERAVQDKKLAVKLLNNLYKNEELDFNTVLQGEKDLHKLETQDVHSKVETHIALVNLYKALGGSV